MLERITLKHITLLIIVMKVAMALYLFWGIINKGGSETAFAFDWTFVGYLLTGFVAQLIDGALGMAHGVTCTSLLFYFGVSPAVATASVHTTKVFTAGASGLSHLYLGNVDRKLLLRLILPGILGAVIGAYMISEVLDGKWIKPYITMYLLFLGVLILLKSFRTQRPKTEVKFVSLLGAFGGFFDSIGGGGWGPIVTSNIVNQGSSRYSEHSRVFCSFFQYDGILGICGGRELASCARTHCRWLNGGAIGGFIGSSNSPQNLDVSGGDHHYLVPKLQFIQLVILTCKLIKNPS
jgi:hypothetical protein